MANGKKRVCSIHKKACALPMPGHGAIGGISCKDFSKNRTTGQSCSSDSVYLASSSPGKSADCMHGFIALLDKAPPDWFLLENSDELVENPRHDESLNLFVYDMCAKGFDVRVFTANARDYMLPQSRDRSYILGVMRPLKYFQLQDYTKFFQNVEKLIKAFMCQPIPLADALLSDDDPIVQKELQASKARPLVNEMTSKEMDEHRQSWRKLGLRHLPGCTRVKQADRDSEWFPCLALSKRTRLEIIQHKFQSQVLQHQQSLDRAVARASDSSLPASVAGVMSVPDAKDGCMM